MESGAGRHWTEEEVKALLSVWSEKSIRKQLHGTLRNKGIFIYIAQRLQELGICRDWKQCRAKYKNLKYEYRTVKYAHHSGDATKNMKFFHELDAILQHEPVTPLAEEDHGRCAANDVISATRENNAGEISVTLEDEEDAPTNPLLFISHCRPIQLGNSTAILDTSKNLPFIPSVANEGGKHWTVNEVRALIRVWSDKCIQQQLERTVRNKRIFEHIAARLQKFGIDRDWKQCRTKYKNLKHEYKSVKDARYLGNRNKSMKFFRELDVILGHGNAEKTSRIDNGNSEKPVQWTDTTTEKNFRVLHQDPDEEDSLSNMSGDLGGPDTRKTSKAALHSTVVKENYVNGHLEEQVNTHPKEDMKEEVTDIVAPEDDDSINIIPDGKELQHLKQEPIDLDDDSISTTSEDTTGFSVYKHTTGTDHQTPLDEAQNHFRVITINDAGAGKHWCDNEVRALINIWSDEEIQQMLEGATRNKEIFEEVARRLMKVGIDRDWRQCRTKYNNLKYEYRTLQKENGQHGNAKRKMRFYDEVDCILGDHPAEPSLLHFKKSTSEIIASQLQRNISENVHSVIKKRKTLLERFYKQEEIQDTSRTHLNSVLPAPEKSEASQQPLNAISSS